MSRGHLQDDAVRDHSAEFIVEFGREQGIPV